MAPLIERRRFLQGVFGGVTAAGVIVAATPAEIAALTPLVADHPVVLDTAPPVIVPTHVGEHLYNARGEVVGLIDRVSVDRDTIETTTLGDVGRRFIQGMERIRIEAVGLCTVECRAGRFELRGRRQ